MAETTQTGIPIVDCGLCGRRHPATRRHCEVCGVASLFPHDVHGRGGYDPRRDGSRRERLAYWRERLAIAEHIGRPAHIARVRERVDGLEALVRHDETKEA